MLHKVLHVAIFIEGYLAIKAVICRPAWLPCHKFLDDIAQCRTSSYGAVQLVLNTIELLAKVYPKMASIQSKLTILEHNLLTESLDLYEILNFL